MHYTIYVAKQNSHVIAECATLDAVDYQGIPSELPKKPLYYI